MDLESNVPTLHHILRACVTVSGDVRARRKQTHVCSYHPDNAAILGLCAAVLLQHRNHSMRPVQQIILMTLQSGHSGKQVHNAHVCRDL